jgi:hypothetical protein
MELKAKAYIFHHSSAPSFTVSFGCNTLYLLSVLPTKAVQAAFYRILIPSRFY